MGEKEEDIDISQMNYYNFFPFLAACFSIHRMSLVKVCRCSRIERYRGRKRENKCPEDDRHIQK